MLDHAERVWRRHVADEEADVPSSTTNRLRWVAIGIVTAALLFLVLSRIG